jgi:hypothetical protein
MKWWLALFASSIAVTMVYCSHPLRFDPHRQELERQQDECLKRGGSPKDCRP